MRRFTAILQRTLLAFQSIIRYATRGTQFKLLWKPWRRQAEPHPKKQCTEDVRGGEESDDSSVVFTGSAPAPPAPPAPSKSIKVMKEAIRAAGLGTPICWASAIGGTRRRSREEARPLVERPCGFAVSQSQNCVRRCSESADLAGKLRAFTPT